MPYCVQSDLVERFGTDALAQLTDQTAAADPASPMISKACDEATSLIDSYLAASYVTPLVPVPTLVRAWACDIAMKMLYRGADEGHPVRLAFDDAMRQLRDIARGVAQLTDATGVKPPETEGSLSVATSERVFTDDLLSRMPG